jgi:4-diphosphocytidyl-2-C-methyl-D-erythritol kinase
MSLTIAAPGKLNLCLHVGPTREDGYHELVSLFDSVSLHDELSLVPESAARGPSADIDSVDCPGVDGENLVTRALRMCRDEELLTGAPLHVRIDKRVPVAAGMGGGSADAAAILRLVAEIQNRPISDYENAAFALGADVPSQLRPGSALVLGAGERIVPVDPRCLRNADRAYVIVAQHLGLATAAVFEQADRLDAIDPQIVSREHDLLEKLSAGLDLAELCGIVENTLEPAILGLRPELAGVTGALRDAGALAAAFTGSGPTCFGIFETSEAAETAAAELSAQGHLAHAAVPVGPEFSKPHDRATAG